MVEEKVAGVPAVTLPKVGVAAMRSGLVNVAVQVLAIVIVTVPSLQSASPLQPEKVEPAVGVGVRVTTVPELYEAKQVAPQLIWLPCVGLEVEVTVPEPVPDLLTLSKY